MAGNPFEPPILNCELAAMVNDPPDEALLAVKVFKSKIPASINILPDVVDPEFKPGRLAANDFVDPPLIRRIP